MLFYEEYPAIPAPHVLDGFLFALLGLHDVHSEFGLAKAKERLEVGIYTLKAYMPTWNYKDTWSYYNRYKRLSTRVYHKWNTILLGVLAEQIGDQHMLQTAQAWNIHGHGLGQLIDVFTRLFVQEYLVRR